MHVNPSVLHALLLTAIISFPDINSSISCSNGDVRLAGGLLVNQGRVEICYQNQWGTVCHDLGAMLMLVLCVNSLDIHHKLGLSYLYYNVALHR